MSSDMLSIGVFALDIVQADPEPNIQAVRHCLERHGRDMDILVLPELFTTAFAQDIETLRDVAEDDNGMTITELRHMSSEYDVAIGGSYLARIGENFYNRGFVILPDGRCTFYNKRHLFGLSAESRLFCAGSSAPEVIEYKGWRMALVVCYDLRFPVWCRRNVENCQYDILFVVANWPVSRAYAWEHLLIARAIENQAVVVGADRSGHDDFGDYDNMTHVYDPTGHEVILDEYGALSIARVSHQSLVDVRQRWPMANDADNFYIR